MLTKIKKLGAILLLVTALSTYQVQQAHALAPLALAPIAAGLLAGTAIATYIGYKVYKPANIPTDWGTGSVYTYGYGMARLAYMASLEANQYGQEILKAKLAQFYATKGALQSFLAQAGNKELYPALYDQYFDPGGYGDPFPGMPIGTKFVLGGQWETTGYTHSDVLACPGGGGGVPPAKSGVAGVVSGVAYFKGETVESNCGGGTQASMWYWVNVKTAPPPPQVPKTNEQLAYTTPGPMSTTITDELDNAIAAAAAAGSTGTFSVIDSTHPNDGDSMAPAAPYVPPAVIETPVDTSTPITGLNTATVAATSANATAAQNAVTSAQAQVTAAESALAQNPADPALQAAVEAAQAALAAAQAAADIANEAAKQAQVDDQQVYPNASGEALKTLDFSKWLTLRDVFSNVWPFSLLTGLHSIYEPLVADPTPPIFVIDLPLGNHVTVDLTMFEPIALVTRWSVALLLSAGGVFFLVRFWRGV